MVQIKKKDQFQGIRTSPLQSSLAEHGFRSPPFGMSLRWQIHQNEALWDEPLGSAKTQCLPGQLSKASAEQLHLRPASKQFLEKNKEKPAQKTLEENKNKNRITKMTNNPKKNKNK